MTGCDGDKAPGCWCQGAKVPRCAGRRGDVMSNRRSIAVIERLAVRRPFLPVATLSVGCGARTTPSPTAPPTMPPATITGTVVDRVNGGPVSGPTVLLDSGSATLTTTATDRTFRFASVPLGTYRVVISSPAHVTHTTLSMVIDQSAALQFSVIRWGVARVGQPAVDAAQVSDHAKADLRRVRGRARTPRTAEQILVHPDNDSVAAHLGVWAPWHQHLGTSTLAPAP